MNSAKQKIQLAAFGAGCFWDIEDAFQHKKGIINTTVGYMGGALQNHTYEQMCSHQQYFEKTGRHSCSI